MLSAGCKFVGSHRGVTEPGGELVIAMSQRPPEMTADAGDPAWDGATVIRGLGLALHSPAWDQQPPTTVALLWDRDYLYVRFTSTTSAEPVSPYGTQHDAKHYMGDVVEIFLDPVGDGRQYFEIQQSPAGGILDQNTTLTAAANSDSEGRLLPQVLAKDYWPNLSYDMPGLRNASHYERHGDAWVWIADFALPAKAVLKRVGESNFSPRTLRLNLVRYAHLAHPSDPNHAMIAMNWSPVKWGCPHQSPAAMRTIRLAQ